ncbi:MAG: (d)CMP kinase [Pyrinomonadaceae bacterium]
MIIAIDGPSGAGKSTLGKRLARAFGLLYLDTGAMYRAVGYASMRAGLSEDEDAAIAELAASSKITLEGIGDTQRVYLNGEEITSQIRTPEVSHRASVVSAIPDVRTELVRRQQMLGKAAEQGAILDGRDIGTVVFPNADIKFFLTADAESRAQRRYREDLAKGLDVTFEHTLQEIKKRDTRDATREHSPLIKAPDAIEIDTSSLNEDEVFEKLAEIVRRVRS